MTSQSVHIVMSDGKCAKPCSKQSPMFIDAIESALPSEPT